jgi:hypothetical protein
LNEFCETYFGCETVQELKDFLLKIPRLDELKAKLQIVQTKIPPEYKTELGRTTTRANSQRFCYTISLSNTALLDNLLSQWSIRFSSIITKNNPLKLNVEIVVSTESKTTFQIPNGSVSYPNLSFGLNFHISDIKTPKKTHYIYEDCDRFIIQDRVHSQCIFESERQHSFHAAFTRFRVNQLFVRNEKKPEGGVFMYAVEQTPDDIEQPPLTEQNE